MLVEAPARPLTENGMNLIGTDANAEDAGIKVTLELWRFPYDID